MKVTKQCVGKWKKGRQRKMDILPLYGWINGAGVMSGGQDAKSKKSRFFSIFSSCIFNGATTAVGEGRGYLHRSRKGNKSIGILLHLMLSPPHFPTPMWSLGCGNGVGYGENLSPVIQLHILCVFLWTNTTASCRQIINCQGFLTC